MIILHDSNINGKDNPHKDGRIILAWTGAGVAQAIHEFTLTCWNPGSLLSSKHLSRNLRPT